MDPTITITKTDTFTANTCTDTVQYEVIISNFGAASATTVVFDDTVDVNTNLEVGSVTTTTGSVTVGNTAGDTTIQVNNGSIATGDSVVIRFNAIVKQGFSQALTVFLIRVSFPEVILQVFYPATRMR